MNKKGFSIFHIPILIIYTLVVGIPIWLFIKFLLNLPRAPIVVEFLCLSCLGTIVLSFIFWPLYLFMLWLTIPLYTILIGPAPSLVKKIKKYMGPMVFTGVFLHAGMDACGIWDILGVGGPIKIFYKFLIMIFLSIFFAGLIISE